VSGSKVIAIVAGVLLALGGLAAGAVGGLLFGVFGGDGDVASGTHRVSTAQSALVVEIDDIEGISSLDALVGDPRVSFGAKSRRPVFVGIGPARQVDRYLASAAVDEVTDFEIDPFALEREQRAGSRQPGAPAAQRFWVARASGRQATLRWKVADGDYRLVLMNADGSRGVGTSSSVGLTLPHVARTAWALVIGGALLLLAGIGAGALALRRRTHA
jgi:hypothetical protein